MKESRENVVELKGFQTSLGIKSIIDFFYTGILEISSNNITSILDAASHLQVKTVISLCTNYLIQSLTILNCVSIYKLAQKYFLPTIINASQQYLNDNIIEIYQFSPEQFFELSFEQVKNLLNNDCLRVTSELDLFLMIVIYSFNSNDCNFR
jgi:kelch-like protein 9/13